MFNVDFYDIAKKLLPPKLKVQFNWEFLRAMLRPLRTLNDKFVAFKDAIEYKLQFNAQVIYLEHYLNDQYDPVDRNIYIEDKANINYVYLYNKIEQRQPLYLRNKSENEPTVYLRNKTEYASNVDFIVWVPVGISFSELVMRSQILVYNNAGRRFEIKTF